jgi:hypothetical protein
VIVAFSAGVVAGAAVAIVATVISGVVALVLVLTYGVK